MYLNTNLSISHLPTAGSSGRITRDTQTRGVATLVQIDPPISSDKGKTVTDGAPVVASSPAEEILRVPPAGQPGGAAPTDYDDWVNNLSRFRTQANKKVPEVDLPKTALAAADGRTAPPPLPVPASKSCIASGAGEAPRAGIYGGFFDRLFCQG